MMYNDHGIMPSEIMMALSNAYKQNEQNSRQNTKLTVESFFTTLNKAQVEFLSLESMPKDVREVLSKFNKSIKEWQYNIACTFDIKPENIKPTNISNNLFSALSSFAESISLLAKLIESKNIKQISNYIVQGNSLMSEMMSLLAKKSIVIRRYL